MLALPIDEASAKVRTGPPVDDARGLRARRVWAGVVPLSTRRRRADTGLGCVRIPEHVRTYTARPSGGLAA